MTTLIDRIRHDIQQRLEQLLAETDKLRRALVALDPRERVSRTPTAARSQSPAKRAVKSSPTPTAARPQSPANRAVKSSPTPKRPSARAAASDGATASARGATSDGAGATTRAATSDGATATTRTPPGETRSRVLAALSRDGGSTAGEIAKATGLARPTVSTTLSRLAKTGTVEKADRGYRLPRTQARP